MITHGKLNKVLNVLLGNIFILGAAGIVLCQAPPDVGPQAPEMAPGGKPVTLIAIPQDEFFKVLPAPGQFLVSQTTTQFQINYLTGGTNNFGDTCTTWPAQAKTAFNYAASVWAASLQSNVPITINACWATSLGAGVLGHSGPRTYSQNFTGAPQADTWYPIALANALNGSDLDALAPDMDMAFSSTYSWYLGTDGDPGDMISSA